VVVVDDGSTDDTDILMDYFSDKDSRVRYLKLDKNRGISYARNFGVFNSTGEYIAVFDSDDIMHPDRLKKQIKAIKGKDFVTAGYFFGNKSGQIGDNPKYHIPDKKITLQHIKDNRAWPHFMIMAKRECFEEHPYRTARVNDDAYLVWDWFKAGYTYKCMQEPLGIMRGHDGSVSKTKVKEIAKTQKELDKEYTEYEKNSGNC
jgi:teichuronic acid biosynthesis glycosyltransferase TuaG